MVIIVQKDLGKLLLVLQGPTIQISMVNQSMIAFSAKPILTTMKKDSKDASLAVTLEPQMKAPSLASVLESTEHLEKVITHVDANQGLYTEKLMEQ